jgi:hypothetical protein
MGTKLATTLTAVIAIFLLLMIVLADSLQQSLIFIAVPAVTVAIVWLIDTFLQKTSLGRKVEAAYKAFVDATNTVIDHAEVAAEQGAHIALVAAAVVIGVVVVAGGLFVFGHIVAAAPVAVAVLFAGYVVAKAIEDSSNRRNF